MIWSIEATDSAARAGKITINGKEILTPIFMPVGTQACVKGLDFNDLGNLGAKIILANTYHCYLRPGENVVKNLGGLHKFSGFEGVFLTDSGGFQAFSLSSAPKSDGIEFKSHIDGSRHFFTPAKVLDIQYALNSDIMMILDDLVGLPNTKERIMESIRRTIRWAQDSINYHHSQKPHHAHNHIFAIIQGGTDREARRICASEIVGIHCENSEFDGFAIGGLAVGEGKNEMYDTIAWSNELLPQTKPRYLMGVGTPEDIVEGIARGVDMFDCVMPTRNARNGTIFTRFGRLSIKNARFREDSAPIDEKCDCYACANFSRAYLSHLFRASELTYARLASIHNLHYYLRLVAEARSAIMAGKFAEFRREFYAMRGAEK